MVAIYVRICVCKGNRYELVNEDYIDVDICGKKFCIDIDSIEGYFNRHGCLLKVYGYNGLFHILVDVDMDRLGDFGGVYRIDKKVFCGYIYDVIRKNVV